MNDMTQAIIPKSDQINSDDLIGRTMTIVVTDVTIRGGQEQPVSIHYEGDNGKPYKPCKSMSRVLVTAWGADAKKYIGRSMTLYRDPKVKWAGMEVGGIRISHMSDIDSTLTMALTATKGSRKPYTVKPLTATTTAASVTPPAGADTRQATDADRTDAATITEDEATALETRCNENAIKLGAVKKTFGVTEFSQMTAAQLVQAHEMIDSTIAKRKEAL